MGPSTSLSPSGRKDGSVSSAWMMPAGKIDSLLRQTWVYCKEGLQSQVAQKDVRTKRRLELLAIKTFCDSMYHAASFLDEMISGRGWANSVVNDFLGMSSNQGVQGESSRNNIRVFHSSQILYRGRERICCLLAANHKRSTDIAKSRFRRVASFCSHQYLLLPHPDDALHHPGLKCRPEQFQKTRSLSLRAQ